jgi:predicted lysophospholipase L1 biosynthesis ABC-type transport system permease subunit
LRTTLLGSTLAAIAVVWLNPLLPATLIGASESGLLPFALGFATLLAVSVISGLLPLRRLTTLPLTTLLRYE